MGRPGIEVPGVNTPAGLVMAAGPVVVDVSVPQHIGSRQTEVAYHELACADDGVEKLRVELGGVRDTKATTVSPASWHGLGD